MYDENFYADLQQEDDQRGDELQQDHEEREREQVEMSAYPAEGNVY